MQYFFIFAISHRSIVHIAHKFFKILYFTFPLNEITQDNLKQNLVFIYSFRIHNYNKLYLLLKKILLFRIYMHLGF